MARFHFSPRAEADLLSIGDYTLRTWGEAQADRYLAELETCCQMLADNPADNPMSGRSCDDVRPGLRRMEHGKHVVFYRLQKGGGILVVRILHQRMLPERQTIEDES
jgi:toxin ParE1/3/4